jgi:Periplasmic protein involved in polysaccharide export
MTFKKKLLPLLYLLVLCIAVLLVQGCTSPKKVLYLQDVDVFEQQEIDYSYEPVIHKDDLLEIIVNSKDPELALPFNMPMAIYQGGAISTAQDVLGFLVDSDGNIDFPVLGTIYVSGLTRSQLIDLIKVKLIEEDLIKDPIVTVQFQNFKISVIGEVARPGTFNIVSDRITLMEAISMAGDLTIQGKRDRVAVIREKDGKRTIMYHDLRSADVFKSPFYYLKQNDVIYVEPNKARIGQSRINQNNSVGVWLSAMSVLASIVAIIVSANK